MALKPYEVDAALGCLWKFVLWALCMLAVYLIIRFGGDVVRGILRGLLKAFGG